MQNLKILLLVLIIFNSFLIGSRDVYDSTEARYAGIAFRMAESGNLITPQVLPGVPFLAKPPLTFWATALSFKVFHSYHEFFARLPHLIAMLIVLFCGFVWVKKISSIQKAYQFAIIFISSIGFFIIAGNVMTDAFLILGITLTNMGFFYGLQGKKFYGYLFFLGLTVSMLSKGLTGILLSGVCCFFFTLIRNKWKNLLNFPLITGTLMFLILTLPWFILMERANSGFLQYFFIGEHFKRFFVSSWSGDIYGYAHDQPFFTIIVFFIACTLQWFVYGCYKMIKNRKQVSVKKLDDASFFILLSLILPLLILCFARNIIFPYASVAVLPFAMLLSLNVKIEFKTLAFLSLPIYVIISITYYYLTFIKLTDKTLIEACKAHGCQDIYYLDRPSFNSYFYSRDKLKIITKKELNAMSDVYFITFDKKMENSILCSEERCLYKK